MKMSFLVENGDIPASNVIWPEGSQMALKALPVVYNPYGLFDPNYPFISGHLYMGDITYKSI